MNKTDTGARSSNLQTVAEFRERPVIFVNMDWHENDVVLSKIDLN